jgi:hypothetical protein
MTNGPLFFFANLGSDIARCIKAIETNDPDEYEVSIERAYRTIEHISASDRPEAVEEARLLILALSCAREENELDKFRRESETIIEPFANRLMASLA